MALGSYDSLTMIESSEDFIRLRTSPDPGDYRRAATEPAPVEVWRALIADHPDMRFWVAQNKTVPVEILATLAADPDPRVRSMVAQKRKLSPALQRQLARDADEGVRQRLAWNSATTRATLEALVSGPQDAAAEQARARLASGQFVQDRDPAA